MLLALFSENYYQDSSFEEYTVSLRINDFLSILTVLFIVLCIWQYIKAINVERFEEMKYFRAMFDGYKNTNLARAFIFAFLSRRMVFCIILFALKDVNFIYKSIAFLLVHMTHSSVAVTLRPYNSVIENVIEVLNDALYILYLAFVMGFKTKSKWNAAQNETFFYALVFNIYGKMIVLTGKSL